MKILKMFSDLIFHSNFISLLKNNYAPPCGSIITVHPCWLVAGRINVQLILVHTLILVQKINTFLVQISCMDAW
eukprot:SAG11_NODE_19053_length_475_cov_0.946809_1_plen_73_part_10